MTVALRAALPPASPVRVNALHVLAHFIRILLAAGLLAGIAAGDGSVARAQEPKTSSPAPQGTTGERIAAHQKAAQAAIREGRLADARAELEAALALDPREGDTHALLAAVAARAERWTDALASYEKALEIGPARSAHHYGIGVCKRALQDLAGASAALAKAHELGESELASARAALTELRARAAASPAPGAPAPPSPDDLAAAERKQAIATATLAEVDYQLAVVARETGDEAAEGAAIERGLGLAPEHAKLLFAKGSFLLRKGDAPGAVAALEKAQAKEGADLAALYDLGRALLAIPGREAEGRARLAEYRERDEARRAKVSEERRRAQAASLAAKADAARRAGEKATARDLAARALELDPTNALAREVAASSD